MQPAKLVTGQTLPKFMGSRVALIGRVQASEPGKATVLASDSVPVQVTTVQPLKVDSVVEIVGTATEGGVEACPDTPITTHSPNLKMDLLTQAVTMTQSKKLAPVFDVATM